VKSSAAIAAVLLIIPTPALAMDVASFLQRVDALKRLGPFALVSPDFYRLKRLVEADGKALKVEFGRAAAERKPMVFCPPARGKPRVGPFEYLDAINAVPPDRRATTDTKDVLRQVLERKYPCSAAVSVE
jgi:hypothetical protein